MEFQNQNQTGMAIVDFSIPGYSHLSQLHPIQNTQSIFVKGNRAYVAVDAAAGVWQSSRLFVYDIRIKHILPDKFPEWNGAGLMK